MNSPDPRLQGASDTRTFVVVMLGTVMLGAAAFGFSLLLDTPLGPQFRLDPGAFFTGVAATLPLVVFLWWFSNTTLEHFASFRRSQIKFFADIGFRFTPARIALMAVGAGVCEELLFRGVVQTWLDGFSPTIVAIVASNILFGMLHMRTALYALIAGLVGVYLGVLYALTDNLLAPMAAHAFYDAVALEYTRRAIAAYQKDSI